MFLRGSPLNCSALFGLYSDHHTFIFVQMTTLFPFSSGMFFAAWLVQGTLLDSRGENGHSLGAIFGQPGRERRTPSDGVPIYQGSFV